jgi:hypothetical protein
LFLFLFATAGHDMQILPVAWRSVYVNDTQSFS